jgi:hypothetical protein
MFDPELESFKTSIDLPTYAATQGYVFDRRASGRGSPRQQMCARIVSRRTAIL